MKNSLALFGLMLLTVLAFSLSINAQNPLSKNRDTKRQRISLNESWKFDFGNVRNSENPGFDDSKWANVSLPHTWNAEDPFDDKPGYRQGMCWYRKKIKTDEKLRGKRIFIYFEGVNQVADVFLNGKLVGNHIGGYTAFAFDITEYIKDSPTDFENVIAVRVNNLPTDIIPPSATADFNFYGGIYRDVYLIVTEGSFFPDGSCFFRRLYRHAAGFRRKGFG